MSSAWAGQNPVDRELGEAWERQFEEMAKRLGWPCHRPEKPEVWWPGKYPLPDRVVEREGEKEWHELKHKRPTRRGEFGLEGYRIEGFHRLEDHVGQPVLYTIHDWAVSGGKEATENRLEDWFTIDVADLDVRDARAEKGRTYYRSEAATTTIYYWPSLIWEPLGRRWGIDVPDKREKPRPRTVPVGTPLGPPRICPSCHEWHPVGTFCDAGDDKAAAAWQLMLSELWQ